jgi:RNA polymerase sigma-70 factor (ECF subfamily)
MTPGRASQRLTDFEACRRELVALAYRMLGDMGRAEDLVQEAWLRWERQDADVESPRAYLVTIVTRLCLNELDSARARREESRADRLPEPVDLAEGGLARVDQLERISMAFLVVLQRLTPAERAVLLLHDVFDFEHREIGELVGSNAPACRKLLERARRSLAEGRRMLEASPEEHRRLLRAFLAAASAGDVGTLAGLLATDAVMIADGGSEGRSVGGVRNLAQPLVGADKIAAFVVAASKRAPGTLVIEERELNGAPAVVFWAGERAFAAMSVVVVGGKVGRVFFHADEGRLGYLGIRRASGR